MNRSMFIGGYSTVTVASQKQLANLSNPNSWPTWPTWTSCEVGSHRVECPSCGRGGRDRSAGVTIWHDGHGVLHCFRCNHVEVHRSDDVVVHIPVQRKAVNSQRKEKHTRLNEWGHRIWNQSSAISGIAKQYLESRRCVIPPVDSDLKWHPALRHPIGHVGPALVALVTHVHTREPMSLHRTWITSTGKADLDTPRLPLANHSLKDGVIRLYPDDWVTNWLGIAEGIETALSMAWGYWPVWSTIDAGHLAKFPVLAGVGELVIAQDKDTAGMNAASICSRRWADAGRIVLVTDQNVNDLNDVLMEAI